MGYSPWVRKESDMAERLHFTSLRVYSGSSIYSQVDLVPKPVFLHMWTLCP